jgi:acyl-CoA synthetase (AMP-forming)/AMP-acid ligase II
MLTQEQVQGRVRQQYVALAPRSASAPPLKNGETIHAGWLHTGDLVQLSDDGAMKLVDRLKDVIITGGRNVYSAEVEQALAGHPDITDCAVIGRPHPEWGETIVVWCPPTSGISPTWNLCASTAVRGSPITNCRVRCISHRSRGPQRQDPETPDQTGLGERKLTIEHNHHPRARRHGQPRPTP